MWRRQNALAALYDELRAIQVFDRVHDYSANTDPTDDEAYATRQIRRSQIATEIQKLKEAKAAKHTRLSSVLGMLHLNSPQ
jgi:hypothetical protein